MSNNYSMMALSEVLDNKFDELVENCMRSGAIDLNLYQEYDVKRGLRDSTGKGVLTGLTEISDVIGYDVVEGVKEPADGKLYYQGYDVKQLVGAGIEKRFAFEETTYLLLFGKLPTKEQLETFIEIWSSLQELSGQFLRDVIMKAPSANLMNGLQKSILTLYSYDSNPDDISVPNVLRQSLQLVAKMPLIAVYNYHAYRHFTFFDSLVIKPAKKEYSTAENILHMLRPDGKFTPLEARVLDAALVLHAEHGGGNNSTFTNHVVTSSGTDTYSAVAASVASLKGPRHGGANLKVQQMMRDIHENCTDVTSKDAVRDYLKKILNKEAFDGAGLIYGMGHAVYTLSDPREVILKDFAKKLAKDKGMEEEFALYDRVEKEAAELLMQRSHVMKPICANVDFYSGLIYTMLGIPEELFTPLFAISRISGWSAHRLEELVNKGKIIRPAYKYVGTHREFPNE
ncbi:MAG: citrate/2-methylcitrate synthase [Butyribacter sp.]|nr:citrate/2-methylcitrate synthase [bacterium]MDY3853653.1 citrate/2-methylcitrate synthase [Butyribacter sp.]